MCICPEGYREVGIDQCVGKYDDVGIVHGPFGFLFYVHNLQFTM